jgi:DUF1365 family protein
VTARAGQAATSACAPVLTPAIYECQITHARTAPLRNVFGYRSYQWLVDLDQLPRPRGPLRWLAAFHAADHLGDPQRSIRCNLDRFLAAHGIDLGGGRVIMLSQARVLGYVFNPLTVYWCHRADGALECVVAEVHNTYHQRHCYLLRPDERGRADVAKEFYVSPFYPVEGTYRMSLPEPGQRLALSITLHQPAGPPFAASMRGRRVGSGPAALLAASVRHPWSTAVVTARIRWQGSKLYARGLRVVPRPPYVRQEGVQ